MKVRDLIRTLEELDPTGELECFVSLDDGRLKGFGLDKAKDDREFSTVKEYIEIYRDQ